MSPIHSATQHFVDPLDLTLLLPFRLRSRAVVGTDEAARAVLSSARCKWEEISDLVRRFGVADEDGYAYAEVAYFHPFVRKFLYGGDRAAGQRPIHAFRLRPGIVSTVDLSINSKRLELVVSSVRLYLMGNRVAILTLDARAAHAVSWEDARTIVSEARRVSFPYYRQSGGSWTGGGASDATRFLPLQREAEGCAPVDHCKTLRDSITDQRMRLLPHWRELLEPLHDGPCDSAELSFEIMGDHRMAVMALAGVETAKSLSDDEWFAISEADEPGFPVYAPEFRDRELAKAVYDRWWDPSLSNPGHSHRYLAGPLTFLSILVPRPGIIERLRQTWRRQFFQLFFLAHYQRAALLALQQDIAEATRGSEPNRETKNRIVEIQREMAHLSSERWFAEPTPQIQGQELYELLKQRINLDRLYREVIDDKSLLGTWALAREEQQREDWRDRINKLTVYLVPVSLGLSAVSAIFALPGLAKLVEHWLWPQAVKALPPAWQALAAGIFILVIAVIVMVVVGRVLGKKLGWSFGGAKDD